MDIARKIASLPDIACFPFEAEKRLIGRTSSLLGVESNPGTLLLAVDCQDLGIEIEDHRGGGTRLYQKSGTEPVVEILEKSISMLPSGIREIRVRADSAFYDHTIAEYLQEVPAFWD